MLKPHRIKSKLQFIGYLILWFYANLSFCLTIGLDYWPWQCVCIHLFTIDSNVNNVCVCALVCVFELWQLFVWIYQQTGLECVTILYSFFSVSQFSTWKVARVNPNLFNSSSKRRMLKFASLTDFWFINW